MVGCIWLIGGTTESQTLASVIASHHLPCIVTVTTEAAKLLYSGIDQTYLKVRVGKLLPNQMPKFCQMHQVIVILDASHPYALEVSQAAIAVSRLANIPYLRYERPNIISASPQIIQLDSFNTLLTGQYLVGQRVLLTVGSQILPQFINWQTRAILFTRILPTLEALQIALESGFTSERILALRPPVGKQLELALWQKWRINLVVTKASGRVGGEATKREVAHQLNIPLIVIERPKLAYPQLTDDIQVATNFCLQHLPKRASYS